MKTRMFVVLCGMVLGCATTTAHPALLLQSVTDVIWNADGSFLRVTHYTYDGRRLVQSVSESDFNEDGIFDERSTATTSYNKRGERVLLEAEVVSLPGGTVEQRGTITYEYDKRGKLIGESLTNTLGIINQTTFIYDSRGNLTGLLVQSDNNEDGTWDSVTTFARTYDAHGHITSETREVDSNLDGTPDLTVKSVFTLDANGNVTLAVKETDYDGDGVVDWTERQSYQYNSRGDRSSSVIEYYEGTALSAITRLIYEYGKHDVLLRTVQEFDWGADGVIDSVEVTTRAYL